MAARFYLLLWGKISFSNTTHILNMFTIYCYCKNSYTNNFNYWREHKNNYRSFSSPKFFNAQQAKREDSHIDFCATVVDLTLRMKLPFPLSKRHDHIFDIFDDKPDRRSLQLSNYTFEKWNSEQANLFLSKGNLLFSNERFHVTTVSAVFLAREGSCMLHWPLFKL